MSSRENDEFERTSTDSAELPEQSSAEELPPVQPPSAGFIIQLFLVPAIIVLVIVGLFFTFRTLVSGNQDWQSLVAELRSSNEHRRWRGAHGLAQMLQSDAQRGDEGEHLSLNPQIANELSSLTKEQLNKHSDREDDKSQLAFLVRTLGYLDAPGTVVPILQISMKDDQDREVRKNAIASLAQIIDRGDKAGKSLNDPKLTADMLTVSSDSDPLVRQMSAYLLGLLSDSESLDRLNVLLQDADANTRLNAAIGLARRESAAGYDVLVEILMQGDVVFDTAQMTGTTEEERQQRANAQEFEQLLSLSNSLKAVADISTKLSEAQQTEMRKLIEPLVNHRQPRIRVEAQSALNAVSSSRE